jgi:hypothetical protein
MTREFCTLFDSNYVLRAVTMHRSLVAGESDFHLTCFCFDQRAKEVVDRLNLPRLSTVSLAELEAFDQELLSVKEDRSPLEYCWTATPALPRYMFGTRPELNEVTYIDADLMFFSDPQPLFDEMGDASVLIIPHRFSPEYVHHAINGIYNVQFMIFRRAGCGEKVLDWWHDRCVEWCYYRLEDGKLGDQKYLDDWPARFGAAVHVLQHKGGGLAPWNVSQYHIRRQGEQVFVDDDPVIFYHYHGLRLRPNGRHRLAPPGYLLAPRVRGLIYEPYLAALHEAAESAREQAPEFPLSHDAPAGRAELVREARIALTERTIQRVGPLMSLRAHLATRGALGSPPNGGPASAHGEGPTQA